MAGQLQPGMITVGRLKAMLDQYDDEAGVFVAVFDNYSITCQLVELVEEPAPNGGHVQLSVFVELDPETASGMDPFKLS